MEHKKVKFKNVNDLRKFLKTLPDEMPVFMWSLYDGVSELGAYEGESELISDDDDQPAQYIAFGEWNDIEQYR